MHLTSLLLLFLLIAGTTPPSWADATSLKIDLPGATLFETRQIPAVLWMSALERSDEMQKICKDVAPKNQQLKKDLIAFIAEDPRSLCEELEHPSAPAEMFFFSTRCGYSTVWQLTNGRFKYLSQTNLILVLKATRQVLDKLRDAYLPYLESRLEVKNLSRLEPVTGYPQSDKPFDFRLGPVPNRPRKELSVDEIARAKALSKEHRKQLVALAGSEAVDQLDARLDSILERHPTVVESDTKAKEAIPTEVGDGAPSVSGTD